MLHFDTFHLNRIYLVFQQAHSFRVAFVLRKSELLSGKKQITIATMNLDILAIKLQVILQILYGLIKLVAIVAKSTLSAVRIYVVAEIKHIIKNRIRCFGVSISWHLAIVLLIYFAQKLYEYLVAIQP